MRIFIIHPVRNITKEWKNGLAKYVKELERQGHSVYDPIRDTNQNDDTGLQICKDNKAGIKWADRVDIAWDGKSTGCLFDIGETFVLEKKIKLIPGYFPKIKMGGKSFVNMIHAWEAKQNNI